jgi:hypothetical protein
MDNSSEKYLTIKIRSPSLQETLSITVQTDATIFSLKEAIQPVHPQHPSCADQRIIYSGKLLQDTEIISTIINKVFSLNSPLPLNISNCFLQCI